MIESLRILILEDNAADADLVQFELREAGVVFTAKVVMTKNDFIHELREFSPDIILSDYDLPEYNGTLALAEARKICPDTPFILVTGAVGEDRAIEILTQGAKDYVLKSRLQQRLVPAVLRALAEAKEQKARKKAEEELREAHRNLESQIEERTAELKRQVEHRSRIEASLLRYNERLEILSYTAGQLLVSDKPQQLVEELCRKVMKFLECDVFFNFIVDDLAGRLHLNAFAGIGPETAHEIEWLDFGVAVCGCVAREGFRIVAENIPTTPDVRTELVKSFGIKAYACHPLLDQKRVLGTLSFGARNRTTFSADDLSMMKAVADQVAIAMARVRSENKLKQLTERFEMAQQAAEVGTWDWDVISGRIEWSNLMFHLFGLDPQETPASFESWKSIIHPEDIEISSLRIEEALRQKTTLNSDYRIVRPNGEIRWIRAVGEGKYDDNGRPIRMIGICMDITRSKKAEEALRESESREKANAAEMQAIMDLAPVAIWIAHDPLCLRITGNKYADEIMNVSRKSNISASALPGEAAAIYKVFQKGKELKAEELPAQIAASTGKPVKEEIMDLVFSDGRIVTIIEGSMPLFDAEGRVRGSVTAGSDLTRLLHVEEALRASEERYRELVQASPEAVIVHLDGQFLYANPAALRLYGAESLDQLQRKTVLDLIPEDERAEIAKRMKQGTAGERLSLKETKLMRLDGQIIPVESVGGAVTYDGKPAVQIMIRDITERKRMEKEQENFNRTLRAINKSNQVMMRATDEYAYMKEICKIIVEDCGHTMVWIGFAEDDEGKTVRPVAFSGFEEGYINTLKITWADTERGRGPTGTAIRTGKPATCRNMLTDPRFEPWRKEAIKRGYASSIVLPLKTGDKAFGALTIYSTEPDSFTEDEVKLLAELANDLSHGIMAIRWQVARVKAEGELRAERDFTTAVLNTAGAAVVVLDKAGRITRFNRTCEKLTGYAEAEVLGKVVWEFLIPKDELAGVHQAWEALHVGDFPNLHENHWVAKDGSRRLIAWANTAIVGPQGEIAYIIGTGVDITERKAAEEQLTKQAAQLQERKARLEEINSELESFSYSISHDLRAPLRAIDGFSRIILRQLGDKFDEKTRHQFNLIRDNIKLMGVLIEDLLSFSRVQKTSMSISEINMDKLAREVWDEIREANKERKLNFKIKKIPPGYGDHTLIRQVLFNLFSNAVKFTKNKKQAVIEMSSYKDNGKTVYCIKDNGAGFDMEHCDKLFGVFQRLHSNEEYEGTGIGLAIVQRIVSRHGGRVWAEGEVEKGATFFFTLNSIPVDGATEQRRKKKDS